MDRISTYNHYKDYRTQAKKQFRRKERNCFLYIYVVLFLLCRRRIRLLRLCRLLVSRCTCCSICCFFCRFGFRRCSGFRFRIIRIVYNDLIFVIQIDGITGIQVSFLSILGDFDSDNAAIAVAGVCLSSLCVRDAQFVQLFCIGVVSLSRIRRNLNRCRTLADLNLYLFRGIESCTDFVFLPADLTYGVLIAVYFFFVKGDPGGILRFCVWIQTNRP